MYISIDMGGTNTRIASTKNLLDIERSIRFKTHKSLISQKNTLNYEIKKLLNGAAVEAICLGIPGTLDRERETFIKLPNYTELDGKAFKTLLVEDFDKTPLLVVNDAHLAGYYESLRGVGSTYKKILYLSIGTGIGGLFIDDKDVSYVFNNFEPGHEFIFEDGLDFESYCSGHNFHKRYKLEVASYASTDIWKDYSVKFNIALDYFSKKYRPDVFVLGGGFSINNFNLFSKYITTPIPVLLTDAGDLGGILGGFCMLKTSFN